MRLSDIMGHMDLAFFAEAGLVIFLIVFAGVVIRVLMTKGELARELAAIPLNDGVPAAPDKDCCCGGNTPNCQRKCGACTSGPRTVIRAGKEVES